MAKDNKEKLNKKPNLERFAPQSVDSAMQTFAESEIPEAPKKKKNGWLSNVLLVVVIVATLYIMLQLGQNMGDGIKSFDEVLANSDKLFMLITVGVLLLLFTLESSKYATIISVIDGRPRWKESIKVMFLGKYYDNVTPFASGGQPWQISYLNKKGFSGGTSTAVVMIKYVANIFMWLMVSAIAMTFNKDALTALSPEMQGTLVAGGWLGWAINMILPVFAISFLLMPRVGTAIVRGIVRLGAKIRIIKNEEKMQNKAFKLVKDFKAAISIMVHHPWRLVVLLLLCMAEVTLVFALPYFVMRAYNGLPEANGIATFFDVITLNVFATLAVAVVPTPGNSGALESMVMGAFSKIAQEVVFWVVLTWRTLVYYVYILVGFGITIFEMIRNAVNKSKQKRLEKQSSATQSTDVEVAQQDDLQAGADQAEQQTSDTNCDEAN